MEKIIARRTGLSIILIDIIYSIIALILKYGASLEMGIGFAVLAIVLFCCIFLFRWSEKKYRQEHQEKEVIEG
jgi:large-conductance mechanosensitive channel